jgi:hypothetical protein
MPKLANINLDVFMFQKKNYVIKKWISMSVNVEQNPNIMIYFFHQCPLQYCKIEIRGGSK